MAYLGDLVARKIFRDIYISFLPVGHTHEDIDQVRKGLLFVMSVLGLALAAKLYVQRALFFIMSVVLAHCNQSERQGSCVCRGLAGPDSVQTM